MKKPESTIQTEILHYLDTIGAWHIKTITTNKRGCPDILGVYNGLMFAIEVKSKPNTPTKLQQYHLNNISSNNGLAIVAYSLDDVTSQLKPN
jgi:Holliday junction resolvase